MNKQQKQTTRIKPDEAMRLITKTIEGIAGQSGKRVHEVFADWIQIAEAALRMEPEHLRALAETGRLVPDPADVQMLWARIRRDYGAKHPMVFRQFFEALTVAKDLAATTFYDLVGSLFMAIGNANAKAGQYFTPFEVAIFMGRIIGDAPQATSEVYERLHTAIMASPIAQAIIAAHGGAATTDMTWFWHDVMPFVMPRIKPVTVCDPACGSGVMFLGFADNLPRWICDWGLVEFYGQDIDATCALLASINIRLHRLNRTGMVGLMLNNETWADAVIDWSRILPCPRLLCSPPDEITFSPEAEPLHTVPARELALQQAMVF